MVLIPDPAAAGARLVEGTEVDVALDPGGRVVLTPVPPTPRALRPSPGPYRLEDLLAGITDHDQPPELFADAPRGDEAW